MHNMCKHLYTVCHNSVIIVSAQLGRHDIASCKFRESLSQPLGTARLCIFSGTKEKYQRGVGPNTESSDAIATVYIS